MSIRLAHVGVNKFIDSIQFSFWSFVRPKINVSFELTLINLIDQFNCNVFKTACDFNMITQQILSFGVNNCKRFFGLIIV